MYEHWKLYVDNYSSYCVRTKVLTKFLTFHLLIPKCIGIFLSPFCIYVLNMKAVCWYRVKTKVLRKLRCDLDLWPLDLKIYPYLPLAILHLCMKYERCTLKITQVIVSEPMSWQSSVVTLTFHHLTQKCISIILTILHLCMKYESFALIIINQDIASEPKCSQSSVVTLTFGAQNV